MKKSQDELATKISYKIEEHFTNPKLGCILTSKGTWGAVNLKQYPEDSIHEDVGEYRETVPTKKRGYKLYMASKYLED